MAFVWVVLGFIWVVFLGYYVLLYIVICIPHLLYVVVPFVCYGWVGSIVLLLSGILVIIWFVELFVIGLDLWVCYLFVFVGLWVWCLLFRFGLISGVGVIIWVLLFVIFVCLFCVFLYLCWVVCDFVCYFCYFVWAVVTWVCVLLSWFLEGRHF